MIIHYESTEFEDVSDADFKSLKNILRNRFSHGIVFLPGEGVHTEEDYAVDIVSDNVNFRGNNDGVDDMDANSSVTSTPPVKKKE